MARLTVHTVETAPEAAKPRVEAALKNNGFIPNLIGVLANAPEALAVSYTHLTLPTICSV